MINQPVKEKNCKISSAIFSRWLRGWPRKYNSTWSLTADDTTGSSSVILPAAALHLLRYISRWFSAMWWTWCNPLSSHQRQAGADRSVKCTQKLKGDTFVLEAQNALKKWFKQRTLIPHLDRRSAGISRFTSRERRVRWTRCQFHRFTMQVLLATINPAFIRSAAVFHTWYAPAWMIQHVSHPA